MTIKSILSICVGLLMLPAMKASEPEKKTTPLVTVDQANTVMERQVSELMAERVGLKKDMVKEKLAEAVLDAEIARENLMFPADELYGSNWNTRWVDPFKGETKVDFPDSCIIDCSSFVFPIDTMLRVTSKYGPRRRRMHKGIDLKVYTGDTIRAAFDGKVRIRNYERRGYGYYVVIRHPNGLETIYGHLSKQLVNVNDIVHAGDPIGLGGNTGRSTGSHLHFETRFLGQAINPADIIDFENGVPIQDTYVFRNLKINGKKSNIYTSSSDRLVYHRVKSGDTLGKIARIYGTTVSELCRLNGIKPTTVLRIGQALRCSAGENYTARTQINEQKEIRVEAQAEAVSEINAEKANTENTQPVYHKIKSGDTLGAIAKKYGTTVSKLCELNGIKSTTILRLGQVLRCS